MGQLSLGTLAFEPVLVSPRAAHMSRLLKPVRLRARGSQ